MERPKKPTVASCSIPKELLKRNTVHDVEVNCLDISRDGTLLATGGGDKQLIVFDIRSSTLK
jgi:autophagy-related protein 16